MGSTSIPSGQTDNAWLDNRVYTCPDTKTVRKNAVQLGTILFKSTDENGRFVPKSSAAVNNFTAGARAQMTGSDAYSALNFMLGNKTDACTIETRERALDKYVILGK